MATTMPLTTNYAEPRVTLTAGELPEGEVIPVEFIDRLDYRAYGYPSTATETGSVATEHSKTLSYRSPNVADRLVCVPTFKPMPRPTLVAMQEWEGTVVEINEDQFAARLIDVTNRRKYPDEEATFPITELSESDTYLLRAGAIFRWVIGIQRLPGGTKQRISQLVFRRLPMWTKADIDRADELAARWSASLDHS
jgi:hypothetical protein